MLARNARIELVQLPHPYQSFQQINDTYRSKRVSDGLVEVFNQHSYLMAKYNERTGITAWKRVVPTHQRAAIEHWLSQQYPVQAKGATRNTK